MPQRISPSVLPGGVHDHGTNKNIGPVTITIMTSSVTAFDARIASELRDVLAPARSESYQSSFTLDRRDNIFGTNAMRMMDVSICSPPIPRTRRPEVRTCGHSTTNRPSRRRAERHRGILAAKQSLVKATDGVKRFSRAKHAGAAGNARQPHEEPEPPQHQVSIQRHRVGEPRQSAAARGALDPSLAGRTSPRAN